MFRVSKPSLRHFAVMERTDRRPLGSTWLVQDRRNPLRKQFLFVPSRIRSWPVWISRLELMEPTPTRLRNGKVAVLLSGADAMNVRDALRKSNKTSGTKLNALTGFEKAQRKSRLRIALLPALALGFCLLLLVPKEQSLATPKMPPQLLKAEMSCESPIKKGEQAIGSLSRFGFLDIAGKRYKIANIQKLGGLAQVKVKRVCDKRYLRLDVWAEGFQLKVERVY